MSDVAKCTKCGRVYDDKPSVDFIKRWLSQAGGYAPCPVITCRGSMEILAESAVAVEKPA